MVNITDGAATDGDPEHEANVIGQLATTDGNLLVFNHHFSTDTGDAVFLPASESKLTNDYARMLFRMSSVLPEIMRERASSLGAMPEPNARGFAFRAGLEELIKLLEIGTRPDNLR